MKELELLTAMTEEVRERYKIICVDDVQCSLVALKRRLMPRYEVYPVDSPPKLFALLEKIKPDIILLDINMPGVDGYETIISLKEDERYAKIPVVFLTSNKDKDSVFKGLNLGAVDYVLKPFDTTGLIACIEKRVLESRSEKSEQENEDDGKPRILAVDDMVSSLKAIKTALHNNYKVHTISRPENVIDFLSLKKPDLILLDFLMPILNGFDLIPMIREIPAHKDTPIIMLTSEGTATQIKEAIALGASDFIVKPFKENELNEKVAKHLRVKAADQCAM